ncbi:hypothetical protein BSZ39_07635 [Bowdeniella nasicola]|uniref:Carbohydrate kinase PfkB domain-containing protein n=1 Tax=Bowdeniella nasicola TaxID=208480 RepID=A0A1Q5Q1U3_9ACTO|nr:carbohydrate kinase family protein [Bowdeniella nasicola]OKL53787.1 hypothetical protein BSZ39_07635 [Bowdeniella nasicola]
MKVIVVGIANQRTTVPIGSFPVTLHHDASYHHEIRHSVGGMGFSVARALSALGNDVALAAPLGEDYPTALIDTEAYRFDMSTHLCTRSLARTPRSVVLYDDAGARQIFNDLTDSPGIAFHVDDLLPDVTQADITVLTSRRMAAGLATELAKRNLPFAVDLQNVDPMIRDDLAAYQEASEDGLPPAGHCPPPTGEAELGILAEAPVCFDEWVAPFLPARYITMSSSRARGREAEVLADVAHASRAEVCVMTLAERGCLVLSRNPDGSWPAEPSHVPGEPVTITNSLGAGENFLAVLLHELITCGADPITAASRANIAVARLLADKPAHGGITVDRLAELLGPGCAPRANPESIPKRDPVSTS